MLHKKTNSRILYELYNKLLSIFTLLCLESDVVTCVHIGEAPVAMVVKFVITTTVTVRPVKVEVFCY